MLFGYPKTGKTTLFNLVTGAGVEVRAYDDGKREPNVRAVPLPDGRLDRIAAVYPEKKRISAWPSVAGSKTTSPGSRRAKDSPSWPNTDWTT